MNTAEKFRDLQKEELDIFLQKNADYGDSFREEGVLGVMIRQKDKLNRFITLARQEGEGAVKSESLRDTLIDLSNYSKLAIIAHEDGEEWALKKEWEDRIIQCHLLKQKVPSLVCEARHVKAKIARHNKKFIHNMTPEQLQGCAICKYPGKGIYR